MANFFPTFLLFICLILHTIYGQHVEGDITNARVESCKSCRLNRLPEVKQFIFEDLPLFDNIEFKHIQGASPELVLLNEHDKVLERIDLAPLNREECNKLLIKYGFHKKSDENLNLLHDDF